MCPMLVARLLESSLHLLPEYLSSQEQEERISAQCCHYHESILCKSKLNHFMSQLVSESTSVTADTENLAIALSILH